MILFFQPSSQQHQTLIIEEFEPDVFRQLIEYIHTGCVTLQPRTLLGKNFLKLKETDYIFFNHEKIKSVKLHRLNANTKRQTLH